MSTPAHEMDGDSDSTRGEMTGEQITMLAERTAQELLGLSIEDAFALLESGELSGTAAESAMRSMRALLSS